MFYCLVEGWRNNMEWVNIHHSTLLDPEFIGCDAAARGTWLSVLAYACHIECGGRITGAASWTDRQWIQAAGVSRAEVTACQLLRVDGNDVLVNGYPTAAETKVKTNRTNAKKGAMARWSMPHGNAETMPHGMPHGNAKGEGEGKEKGKEAPPASHCDIFDQTPREATPTLVSPTMEACDAKFTHGDLLSQVKRIGGKLTKANGNLAEWEGIIAEHGLDAVSHAAKKVGPAERWPDRVAQAIWDKDKCPHPPGTDAAMNWYALHMEVK